MADTPIRLHQGRPLRRGRRAIYRCDRHRHRNAGLKPHRDRLCVVQLSSGDGPRMSCRSPRARKRRRTSTRLLRDGKKTKIFHFGRFDIAVLKHAFGVTTTPVFCTKIASRLTRTYTDRHGLKDICRELLGVDLSKQQQSSDWAADRAERRTAGIRRLGRAAPARPESRSRGAAGARRPHENGRGLLPFPADPRRSRPRRLGTRKTSSRIAETGASNAATSPDLRLRRRPCRQRGIYLDVEMAFLRELGVTVDWATYVREFMALGQPTGASNMPA
jgi:hypothetical protein